MVATVLAVGCTAPEADEEASSVRADSLRERAESAAASGSDGSTEDAAGATTTATGGGDADTVGDGPTDGEHGADAQAASEGRPVDDASARIGPILTDTGDGLAGEELEQHVARRFEAFWFAFDIARRAPSADPVADYPMLFELAAGEQLDLAHAELTELFGAGHAVREPDRPAIEGLDPADALRVRVDRIDGGVAELVSCLVNDQVRYEVASGAVVSDTVRTVQARSTMARADGAWKLIDSTATELEAGIAGCWLDGEAAYPY